jgi:sarcosine oxidase subunit gamma
VSALPNLRGSRIAVAAVGTRYGVKGADAARWLAGRGIAVPDGPNRAAHWSGEGGGRCLRLGHSEFLIEHDAPGSAAPGPGQAARDGAPAAWILLRSDCSLLLDGPALPDVLAHACSLDFHRLQHEPDLVVMTLLAGIGVTLLREPRPAGDSQLALRLWCDPSYATYLQECLQHLAAAHGDTR